MCTYTFFPFYVHTDKYAEVRLSISLPILSSSSPRWQDVSHVLFSFIHVLEQSGSLWRQKHKRDGFILLKKEREKRTRWNVGSFWLVCSAHSFSPWAMMHWHCLNKAFAQTCEWWIALSVSMKWELKPFSEKQHLPLRHESIKSSCAETSWCWLKPRNAEDFNRRRNVRRNIKKTRWQGFTSNKVCKNTGNAAKGLVPPPCLCVCAWGFRENKRTASYHNQGAVKLSLHCNYTAMHFTACLLRNSPLPPVKPLPTPLVCDNTAATA